MNASITGIIDVLFKDTAMNNETRALYEELLNNCQEHYDDLVSRGVSETEALDAVVESLQGMKEVTVCWLDIRVSTHDNHGRYLQLR